MAGKSKQDRDALVAERAARLVSEALDLLDAHGGPAEAAAHLDLALSKLRENAKT